MINQAGEHLARPLGQSAARWHVPGWAFRPQTVAADMGHARQSVERVADVLEQEALVAYRPHSTDRRTKLVELRGLTTSLRDVAGTLTAGGTRSQAMPRFIVLYRAPQEVATRFATATPEQAQAGV